MEISYKDLELDKENLEEELIKQVSLYSYWSFRLGEKLVEELEIKEKLDREIKKKFLEIKQDFYTRSIKITEKEVESLIDKEDEIKTLKDKLLEIRKETIKIEKIVKILDHRKDILITLSANRRSELSSRL
jgi:hypothetical protein